jgi:hypothetical protein
MEEEKVKNALENILDEIDEHQTYVEHYCKSNWLYRLWNWKNVVYHHSKAGELLEKLSKDEVFVETDTIKDVKMGE